MTRAEIALIISALGSIAMLAGAAVLAGTTTREAGWLLAGGAVLGFVAWGIMAETAGSAND